MCIFHFDMVHMCALHQTNGTENFHTISASENVERKIRHKALQWAMEL